MENINNLIEIEDYKNTFNTRLIQDIKGVFSEIFQDKLICLELTKSVNYSIKQDGKWKRAMLLYLANMCFQPQNYSDQLKYIAASIEIMHNASLVHDDIIDNGLIRREKESVFKKFGLVNALLTGDYLIFFSIKALSMAKLENINFNNILYKINDTYCNLCLGQSMEQQLIGNIDCSIDQYLQVIRHKTAVFFEMICEVGAICGGGETRMLEAITQFGENIGMAYQIRDDVLSLIEDKQHIGKSNTSDLERKLVTLPVILALKNSCREERKILEKFLKLDCTEIYYEEIIRIIKKSKAINQTIGYVTKYINCAIECLDIIPDCYAKMQLKEYAKSLLI